MVRVGIQFTDRKGINHTSALNVKNPATLLSGRKAMGVIPSLLVPVRTNKLKPFAKDLFLPTTLNRVHEIDRKSLRIFATLGAIALDGLTFPIRVVTLIPRMIYNACTTTDLKKELSKSYPGLDLKRVEQIDVFFISKTAVVEEVYEGTYHFTPKLSTKDFKGVSCERKVEEAPEKSQSEDSLPPAIYRNLEGNVISRDEFAQQVFEFFFDVTIDVDNFTSEEFHEYVRILGDNEQKARVHELYAKITGRPFDEPEGIAVDPKGASSVNSSLKDFYINSVQDTSFKNRFSNEAIDSNIANGASDSKKAEKAPSKVELENEVELKLPESEVFKFFGVNIVADKPLLDELKRIRERAIKECTKTPKPDMTDAVFECCISMEFMTKDNAALLLDDATTYIFDSIEEHLQINRISPIKSVECPLGPVRLDKHFEDRCPITQLPYYESYYCFEDGITYEKEAFEAVVAFVKRSGKSKEMNRSQFTLYPHDLFFHPAATRSLKPINIST